MNPFILKSISELDRLLIKHCEVTIHELLRGLQLSFEDFYYLVETKAAKDGMNEARKCLLHWLNLTSVMSHECDEFVLVARGNVMVFVQVD